MVTMARPLIGDKTEAFGADPSGPKETICEAAAVISYVETD